MTDRSWPKADCRPVEVERLLLAESSHSHPRIFRVASVRYTPKAAAQVVVFPTY